MKRYKRAGNTTTVDGGMVPDCNDSKLNYEVKKKRLTQLMLAVPITSDGNGEDWTRFAANECYCTPSLDHPLFQRL